MSFNNDSLIFLLSIFLPIVIAKFLYPIIKYIGRRYNLIDKPNKRKIHKKSLIRIGGLLIFLSFYISIVFFVKLNLLDSIYIYNQNHLFIILISALFFFMVGFLDDIKSINPSKRLILLIGITTIYWLLSFDYLNINIFVNNIFSNDLPDYFSKSISE